jgi:hypothetical protein
MVSPVVVFDRIGLNGERKRHRSSIQVPAERGVCDFLHMPPRTETSTGAAGSDLRVTSIMQSGKEAPKIPQVSDA